MLKCVQSLRLVNLACPGGNTDGFTVQNEDERGSGKSIG